MTRKKRARLARQCKHDVGLFLYALNLTGRNGEDASAHRVMLELFFGHTLSLKKFKQELTRLDWYACSIPTLGWPVVPKELSGGCALNGLRRWENAQRRKAKCKNGVFVMDFLANGKFGWRFLPERRRENA